MTDKLKPILWYTIRVFSFRPHIIGVTTEKARGRWFGRDIYDNTATHGTDSDIRGKFETQHEAEAAFGRVMEITRRYKIKYDELEDNRKSIRRCELVELDRAYQGKDA